MCRAEQIIEISFLRECGLGCVLGFSCCARKAQASPFDIKTALAGRTLAPMPPPGGALTVKRKLSWTPNIGAAVCSAAWSTSCQRVRFCRLTAHPCRSALHKRRVHPPWQREENRMKNFDWVILLGHSKTNFDPQNGEQCEEQKCAWRGIGLAIRLCLW